MQDGGDEAADGRWPARGDQGGPRHRDARPAWKAAAGSLSNCRLTRLPSWVTRCRRLSGNATYDPLPSRLKSVPLNWNHAYVRNNSSYFFMAASRPPAIGSSSGTTRSSILTMSASSRAPSSAGPASRGRASLKTDDAARAEQPDARGQVLGVGDRVRVTEHEVVRAVGQPRQHVERPAQDEPGLVGREAGLGERPCAPSGGTPARCPRWSARRRGACRGAARCRSCRSRCRSPRPRLRRDRGREEPQRGARGGCHWHCPAEVSRRWLRAVSSGSSSTAYSASSYSMTAPFATLFPGGEPS